MKKYSKYLKPKSLIIFLFHGVISKNPFKIRNYTKKHITINEFESVLEDLKQKGGICLSLDEVHKKINKGDSFANYSYSITFDDGFYNNYKYAVPILLKRNLFATFYITTDFIEFNEMSWIDKIEQMVEHVCSKKNVQIFNKKFSIKNNEKSKIFFLKKIRSLAKRGFFGDLNKLVCIIKNQLKYKKPLKNLNNILDKKMNWDQIKKINSYKNFTIGGHTVSHKILSFLDSKNSKMEILNSIKIIYKNTKIKIYHYSYPEGMFHTYGRREVKFLKSAGIKICPSAEFGINTKNTNLFGLKRVFVDK
jgi:peptidoglycan/xylan/chitin deacetylase (PgdA/CDA1 family)